MIRVVAGIYKGKRLKRVPVLSTRPISHKLKESLFSIIQKDIPGSLFLDGFAGTGSVGIEALSRGAEASIFVEETYAAVKTIRENLENCGAAEQARIMHKEFNRAVIQLAKENAKFDLIFLDPPYKLLEERDPLKVIAKREILKKGGRVILRHFYKTKFQTKYFELKRQVNLGDDIILFYE